MLFLRDYLNATCFTQSFSNVGTASGIGDITLRVKGNVWKSKPKDKNATGEGNEAHELAGTAPDKGERAALAIGVDIRSPTGDALNFLGAGTAGVKPFVIWSYRSRISPHVFVGYETNGSSLVAGDISTGKKERFPGQLTYSSGADVWFTKRLTAALDIVGQQVFQAARTQVATFTEPGACPDLNCLTPSASNTDQNLAQSTGTFNITNASLGVKVKPFATLLVTGNVLIKMNNGGLRANAVPLIGLSYAF